MSLLRQSSGLFVLLSLATATQVFADMPGPDGIYHPHPRPFDQPVPPPIITPPKDKAGANTSNKAAKPDDKTKKPDTVKAKARTAKPKSAPAKAKKTVAPVGAESKATTGKTANDKADHKPSQK